MNGISDKEIANRLRLDNPWWGEECRIPHGLYGLPRRFYFHPFLSEIQQSEVRRAVILMGPRRVGKTVMVHHVIQSLLDSGTSPQSVLYVSLDTPIYTGLSLEQLLSRFLELFADAREHRTFIFFDEIQYLREWETHLKSLVDSYPAMQFVASGSAAAALKLKSQESGAGRFTDFMLPPLTFAEYLSFIRAEDDLFEPCRSDEDGHIIDYNTHDIDGVNKEVVNYLNYGGYPEAVFSERIQAESGRYIKSDIVDKVLLRDLPSLYGIQNIQELNRLFTNVAYLSGREVTIEKLSQSSGVNKNTLRKYLEYLEAAFLIRRVNRVDRSAKQFKRITSFKCYVTNPAMRAALFGYISHDSEEMGKLCETAAFSQWLHSDAIDRLYYARWGAGEVDMVYLHPRNLAPRWMVEIKWSNRYPERINELNHLVKFANNNELDNALVTTRTVSAEKDYKGVSIRFRPFGEWLYVLGKNVLYYSEKEA